MDKQCKYIFYNEQLNIFTHKTRMLIWKHILVFRNFVDKSLVVESYHHQHTTATQMLLMKEIFDGEVNIV